MLVLSEVEDAAATEVDDGADSANAGNDCADGIGKNAEVSIDNVGDFEIVD